MSTSTDNAQPSPRRRRNRLRPLVLGAVLGLVVAAFVGIVLAMWFGRNPLPPITRADLEAAKERWDKNGPTSYNIDLMLGGKRPGPIHVEVRGGEVTAMTRDGVTPSQRRTWVYWTVPEQFETIRADFDSAEAKQPFGAPPGTKTIMRAEFDPELGYPKKYQRQVLGTDLDVQWEVTRFEVVR
jgi:Family of unknown function (DUF6174)